MQLPYFNKRRSLVVATAGLLFWLANLSYAGDSPFSTANRTVFVRSLGIPNAEDARWQETGKSNLAITLEQSSLFMVDDVGPEQAFLDGETTSLSLKYRHTMNERFTVGVDLPLLSHNSGFLDSFVEGWHDTFGLPNARRDEFPRDQINFSVSTPTTSSSLRKDSSGLGDVALLLQYRMQHSANSELSAQIRLDLPTGDADKLLGSDSWDTALGLNYYRREMLGSLNAAFHGNIGILLPGDSQLLSPLQKDIAGYGMAAINLPFWRDWLSLKAQLEVHSALYDTSIKSLGNASAQLSFGAGIQLSKHWNLNIGMSEDIAVRTAPDFTFLLSLEYR